MMFEPCKLVQFPFCALSSQYQIKEVYENGNSKSLLVEQEQENVFNRKIGETTIICLKFTWA